GHLTGFDVRIAETADPGYARRLFLAVFHVEKSLAVRDTSNPTQPVVDDSVAMHREVEIGTKAGPAVDATRPRCRKCTQKNLQPQQRGQGRGKRQCPQRQEPRPVRRAVERFVPW